MSGNHSNEYLNAFGKLHIPDLHHSDFSRKDIITLWNSLQSTPNKVRYFTFVLQDNNKVVQDKIKEYYANEKYAYILHDKDKSADRNHYHYLLMFGSPRSFKSIANDLEMPVTNLQKVYSRKGILDYLTHENDPSKHHYDLSEVVANFDIEAEKKNSDKVGGFPIKEFYHDYVKVREGVISVDEFLDSWNLYCATLSITTAIQLCERLYNASCTGARLSSRSECRVPHSGNSPPIQYGFSKIDPNTIQMMVNGSKCSILEQNKSSTKSTKKLLNNILNNNRKDIHGY